MFKMLGTECKHLFLCSIRSMCKHQKSDTICVMPLECTSLAFRFHGRAAYINILSHIEKRWRTLWAHGRTGSFISDPSIPMWCRTEATPSVRCIANRALRWVGLISCVWSNRRQWQTRLAAAPVYIGGSYQVISLSRPCLGDNYRRTTPRDVFSRFSADWQNVSSAVWSLKATWRKYESVLLLCARFVIIVKIIIARECWNM